MKNVIEHYHELLEGVLLDDLRERLGQLKKLKGPIRPIEPTESGDLLRPLFCQRRAYDLAMSRAEVVLGAIDRVGEALREDTIVQEYLRLSPVERELIDLQPGYFGPEASGRLDGFLDRNGEINFIEYNADSHDGLFFSQALADLFAESMIMRQLGQLGQLGQLRKTLLIAPAGGIDLRARLAATLLDSYSQWIGSGRREIPRLAIVDRESATAHAEVESCRRYFEERGIPTIVTSPEALQYRGGWLMSEGFRITLVYKRVSLAGLIESDGTNNPLVEAVRDRAVCLVNGFRGQVLTRKLIFAILDDPAFEYLFDARQIEVLRRHLPWTRLLHEGFTTWHGERIDLPEFVLANREILVLKPSASPSGSVDDHGVTLGWECTASEWKRCVEESIGSRFVIQERVATIPEPFPVSSGSGVVMEDRYAEFSPYTWQSETAAGAGIRLSDSTQQTVSTSGGPTIPLFLIDH
jgi:hypothetical protein